MNKEILSVIEKINTVNSGEPWFGRSLHSILEDVPVKKVYIKPGKTGHSMIELLYHMITWASFTLKRIEKDNKFDLKTAEELDWRVIDPKIHDWEKGVAEFRSIYSKIIKLLKKKDDSFLDQKVDFRNYNFRFLLNGITDHTIYHLGQIAYLQKLV